MWQTGYARVVIISLLTEAVDLGTARINPQAVVLQGTPIPPTMIDYAFTVNMNTTPFTCTFLYAQGISRQIEPIRGK